MKNTVLITILLSILISCTGGNKTQRATGNTSTATADSVRYAGNFKIETRETYTVITLINPRRTEEIIEKYILVPKSKPLPGNLPEGTLIRTPLTRIISAGAVQCSFIAEIGSIETIVGVCEPQYINIPLISQRIAQNKITDTGKAANPDLEKIMLLDPEAIFATPIEETVSGRATVANVPTIKCIDHLESSPLGRAEWIRFYATFFDRRATADSLFAETVSRYRDLQTLSANVAEHRPTVFSETIYSGIWWQPGGNSYVAHLFRDAGAEYIWSNDTNTGSIGLTFETVLEKAGQSDFWLIKYNSPHRMTKETLAADNPKYTLFDAYRKGNIYAANLNNVTYYEDLPTHPDMILKDFVKIFHPEALPDYQTRYYEKIK